MKKSVCLLRHSSIASEFHGRYVGRKNVFLSPEGFSETKILAKQLPRKFHEGKIYLSPSKQVQETFNSLEFPANCDLEIREELQELDFGDWEGKLFSDLFETQPEKFEHWANFIPEFRFPGGESLKQFVSRAEIVRDLIKTSEYKNILILGQGGILSLLLALILEFSPESHRNFRIAPSSYALLDVFQNGDSVLTELVRISQNRRSEWPG